MRGRALVVGALSLVACVPSDKKQEAGGEAPSSRVPRVHFSAQPPPTQAKGLPTTPSASPSPGAEIKTDGREVEAGKRLHAEAQRGCSDLTCLGGKCGKLCVQFMAETYKEGDFRNVTHRNTIYFNCQGACLADSD